MKQNVPISSFIQSETTLEKKNYSYSLVGVRHQTLTSIFFIPRNDWRTLFDPEQEHQKNKEVTGGKQESLFKKALKGKKTRFLNEILTMSHTVPHKRCFIRTTRDEAH